MIERMPYIAWNLLRLWKSLTRHFSESFFPSRSIRLIKSIRSIHFLTRPKQHRKRGTLGSPLGPFCKAIRAEWQPIFGWKSLFWGAGDWWIKKRGAPECSSCQCKDIQKNGQMQIGNKKHWQPPHPISNRTNLPLPAEMRELPLRAQCHSLFPLTKVLHLPTDLLWYKQAQKKYFTKYFQKKTKKHLVVSFKSDTFAIAFKKQGRLAQLV